jgi:glyoxylase-like metal-dependent hydrolase (beta-lactamase superfamily II)
MTLDGTNTWILRSGHPPRSLVVDPGPDDASHLDAVAELALADSAELAGIVLTHGHADHADGVAGLRERTGAPLLRPAAGDALAVGDLTVDVLATPGHTDDSLSLLVGPVLMCGDTVLGRGTSVIAWPDGNLADYLHSLQLLERLAVDGDFSCLLPGHGPVLDEPADVLAHYRRHRLDRIDQVRAARAAGAATPAAIVALVYPELDPGQTPVLHGAAVRTVRATVDYLDRPPPAAR